ncbi:MAG: ester cyclase [Chloroflexia bacterium]|jgi:steroid delta-isomerase-like uncharacterized protein
MQQLDVQTGATPPEIALGLMGAWNEHDVDQVMSYYAPDYVGFDVGQATPEHGLEGKRRAVVHYLHAFPDLYFLPDEPVCRDNTVMVNWQARGTHLGPFLNIPPSGRTIQVRGVSTLKLRDGKIVEAIYVWDVAGLLRNIGLLPDL